MEGYIVYIYMAEEVVEIDIEERGGLKICHFTRTSKCFVMKRFNFLLLICCLVVSCKKDKIIQQNQNQPKPDRIIYMDFQPDIILKSNLYMIINQDPESCGDSPFPDDSTAQYQLDINGDSVNDFAIITSHSYVMSSGSIHCAHYHFSTYITGINAEDSISTQLTEYGIKIANNYDTLVNCVIADSGSTWNSSAGLLEAAQGYSWPITYYFHDTYIGVKVNNNYGWINVSPRSYTGIFIKECGFNTIQFKSINAGQKR
jgi:hypothetical protein